MVLFYPDGHAAHAEAHHPERPERVEAIRSALTKIGCWDDFSKLEPVEVPIPVLHSIQSPTYLRVLEETSRRGDHLDADTYTTPQSFPLAMQSAGGALAVARAVWEGEARRGFALTRPPGHHATRTRGMGFCLLNNISLAAESLLQKDAQRLAIIDLDLHHGNGTQDIFWRRGDTLFVSTHQSPLFPGSGAIDEIGEDSGEGLTVNLPFPPATGDEGFLAAMDEIILPVIGRFQPEMILVSFGFDPHWRDPLGHLLLTADGYYRLVSSLSQYADQHCSGRLALFLEGGYDLEAGSACSQAVVSAMLDLPWQDPLGQPPRRQGGSWKATLREASEIWNL